MEFMHFNNLSKKKVLMLQHLLKEHHLALIQIPGFESGFRKVSVEELKQFHKSRGEI